MTTPEVETTALEEEIRNNGQIVQALNRGDLVVTAHALGATLGYTEQGVLRVQNAMLRQMIVASVDAHRQGRSHRRIADFLERSLALV